MERVFEKRSGHCWSSPGTQPLLLCKGVTMFAPLTHLPHWCSTLQEEGAPADKLKLRLGSEVGSQVAAAFPYHTIATCPSRPRHPPVRAQYFWARPNVHTCCKQIITEYQHLLFDTYLDIWRGIDLRVPTGLS